MFYSYNLQLIFLKYFRSIFLDVVCFVGFATNTVTACF